MLKKLLRFGAVLIAPVLMAGAASADNGYVDPAHEAQGGPYQEPPAIILYAGENFTGEPREIYDPIYALPDLAFNDRARSVAVLAGQWEVCEHSDFTGRCVFLRYDVQDLGWFGLERRVSSVRPIFEYTEAEHGLMFTRDRNGYIRYIDNQQYGADRYSYGYGVSSGISVYHYGYSPDYVRYGYYDPRLGYDPYGFGWHGAYGSHYDRRVQPLRGHYGARDGAVTLYVDSYGRGPSFGLNRAIPDLSQYRFNDNVSSIYIRSGTWEICEHSNFRGRCQIVDASVDRLNGFRLNDQVSSIRPVGGNGYGGGNWTPGTSRPGTGHPGPGRGDRPGTGRDGGHGPGGDGHGDRGPRPGGTTPGNWGDRGGHGPNGSGQGLTGTGTSAPATPPAVIAPPRTSPPPRVTTPPGVARVNRDRDRLGRDPAPRDVRPNPRELAGGTPVATPQPAVSPPRGTGVRPGLRDVRPVETPRGVTPPPARPPRATPPAPTSAPQVRAPQPARPAYTPPPAAPAPQPRPQASSPPPRPEPSRPAARDDSRPPALRGRDR
ncbi:MAG: beta/gamma crystallin-related protein [Hyphomonas sp.]|uniref:beta/gamma crystallin-related protein n=1 Tax=Hyphomonas sp. TaxID=87 RepID=UPI0035271AE1